MMVDGTEGVKDFISEENLPTLVVERLVGKLIGPDVGTEEPFNSVGRVCSLGGSNLVDTVALGVDALPEIDIERLFVGTELDDVSNEFKLSVTVEFFVVGFV